MELVRILDLTTIEGKQTQTAENIQKQLTQSFQYLQRMGNQVMASIFANSFGLSPQQVCDALGTSAGTLVAVSTQVAALLNGLVPGTMSLVPPKTADGLDQQIQVNQDGTVTILVVQP